jgi:uncharacterized protein
VLEILDNLHDPAVRDLAWAVASPTLLDPDFPAYQGKVVSDTWCARALKNCRDWLLHLDQHPQKLHQLIEKRATRRLGYYFETLIEFWLSHASGIQLLAHNLPVKDKLITIGEFDFLLRDPKGKTFHWETAIKFYLQDEASFEQLHFIGPGGYDRLDLKLSKIFDRQLQLSHSPACHVKVDTNMAFVKGMLYYHPSATPTLPPPGISAAHLRGWWVRHQSDVIPQTSTDSCWIILPRLSWLAPAHLPPNVAVMKYSEIVQKVQENFLARNNALLLAELTQDAAGYWREIARGFVVTTIWPVSDAAQ